MHYLEFEGSTQGCQADHSRGRIDDFYQATTILDSPRPCLAVGILVNQRMRIGAYRSEIFSCRQHSLKIRFYNSIERGNDVASDCTPLLACVAVFALAIPSAWADSLQDAIQAVLQASDAELLAELQRRQDARTDGLAPGETAGSRAIRIGLGQYDDGTLDQAVRAARAGGQSNFGVSRIAAESGFALIARDGRIIGYVEEGQLAELE